MTIYTLKFASNLPSFEVVLGSAATNKLPAIIELGGSHFDEIRFDDTGRFSFFEEFSYDLTSKEFSYSPEVNFFYDFMII